MDIDDGMPIPQLVNQPLDLINKIGITKYEDKGTQNTLRLEKLSEVPLRVNQIDIKINLSSLPIYYSY